MGESLCSGGSILLVTARANRMMWSLIAIVYLVFGLAAAGFTLAVFPPQSGYRPPFRWIALAMFSYVMLWPFLAMIALGYAMGQWYRRPIPNRVPIGRTKHRHQPLYRTLYEETPN